MKKLFTIVMLFAVSLSIAFLQEKEEVQTKAKEFIYSEINCARQNPANYGVENGVTLENVDLIPWFIDNDLEAKAQEYAEYLADEGDLIHSDMPYRESILWNYDYKNSINQFITERGAPKGILSHREHLLNDNDKYVGVGIDEAIRSGHKVYYVVILSKA